MSSQQKCPRCGTTHEYPGIVVAGVSVFVDPTEPDDVVHLSLENASRLADWLMDHQMRNQTEGEGDGTEE
jgi:hypothetical protein